METARNAGPTVKVLICTPDPIKTISLAAGTCYGKHDISEKRVFNCLRAGHESVLEHASATFDIGDISRACTHQLVRHRLASYCLPGDAVIYSTGQKRWTVKQLYDWQFDPRYSGKLKLISARSVDEETNTIVSNKIKGIFESGVQDVYELITESGRTLRCSANHRIYTPNGYFALASLAPGDYVYSNGKELLENPEWLEEYYITQNHTRKETAAVIGCCESYVNRAFKKYGIIKPRSKYPNRKPGRGKKGALTEEGRQRLRESKLGDRNPQYKQDRSTLTTSGGYSESHRFYKADSCDFCGSDTFVERHHRNKNPRDNAPENVLKLCSKCHKLWHKKGAIGVFKDRIVDIRKVSVEMTYDIEMTPPFNNVVVDGIVVHNSQQSQRYCKIDVNRDDWYVIPPDILEDDYKRIPYMRAMHLQAEQYKWALESGIKPEDARYLLPEACKTKIVVSMNAREFFHFLDTRLSHRAQWEIRYLAEAMKGYLAAQNDEWRKLIEMYERVRTERENPVPFITPSSAIG